MHVTIVIRKEVADEATALQVYETIKNKVADSPDVEVTGSMTSYIPASKETN